MHAFVAPRGRFRSAALAILAVLLMPLVTSACSFEEPPILVLPHSTALDVPAGQTKSTTILCAAGQALASGGYATNDTITFPFQQAHVSSYPSDANGNPPTSLGQQAPGWTVSLTNPGATTLHMI